MKRWIQQLTAELMRARVLSVLAVALIVDVVKELLKHRIFGAMNEFIDAHADATLSYLRPAIDWVVATPLSILAAALALILIHAYWKK